MIRLMCVGFVTFSFTVVAADPELKGTLTVNGVESPLAHVLVLDFDDVEGMGDGPELRVLFSDKKIDQAALEAPILFNLDALARAGKLQGVLLRFDPAKESREVYGTTYAKLDNPQSSMPFFTLGGDAGGVDSLRVDAGNLGGAVAYAGDGDVDFGIPSYAFDITFSAPIQKPAPVTVLQGKEAMDSVQMKTLLQFEAAMLQGDLETIRKMTSPEKAKQMDDFIAEAGKEQFMAMVKQMATDPAASEKNLAGMYVRGDRTTLVFNEDGGKTSISLIKKGDAWIVD